jgi:hypothetical protein
VALSSRNEARLKARYGDKTGDELKEAQYADQHGAAVAIIDILYANRDNPVVLKRLGVSIDKSTGLPNIRVHIKGADIVGDKGTIEEFARLSGRPAEEIAKGLKELRAKDKAASAQLVASVEKITGAAPAAPALKMATTPEETKKKK